jgi:hypothetical protein
MHLPNDHLPAHEPASSPPATHAAQDVAAPPVAPAGDPWLEVFRRAIVERDEGCWRELTAVYHGHVLGWCRHAANGYADDIEELVGLTWQRFWRHYTPEKLHGTTRVAAILSYLKMCARSVVADAVRLRAKTRRFERPSDERLSPRRVEGDGAERLTHSGLWELVDRHLGDARERTLLSLRYRWGMQAAEIHAYRPDLFPTVLEVYRINRNVLDRLRRSPALRAWCEEMGAAAS